MPGSGAWPDSWLEHDFYAELGVPEDATQEEISRRYRKLAKQLHPDVTDDPSAHERFKVVSAAHEMLSDPDRRARYDRMRAALAPWRLGGSGVLTVDGLAPELLAALVDELRLQGAWFVPGADRSAPFPSRGRDVRAEVWVAFREAARGVTVTVDIPLGVPCPACGGTGMGADGTCPGCHGQRMVADAETVAVQLPPGLRDGDRLRVPHAGVPGSPPGDLYLTVRVLEDPHLRRGAGLDVHTTVVVDALDAMLGTTVTVTSLHGQLAVAIPPGTQPGSQLRLREQGIRTGDGPAALVGDLVVEVQVRTPTDLSAEERELAEQLRALRPRTDEHSSPSSGPQPRAR